MAANSRLCEHALDLAERGYHVFPVRPSSKAPLTVNGFKDATRDEVKILHGWDRRPDANIGIACGASGVSVLDIDSKHGADPAELISRFGLMHYPATVLTGTAPEPSDKFPNSLPGVRGAQLYFAGKLKTTKLSLPGVEIRGVGAYVVAPPSVHPSGVEYSGTLPAAAELWEVPEGIVELLVATDSTSGRAAAAVEGKIPHGVQHDSLVSFAGSMWNRGMTVDAIAAALKVENRTRCEVPGTDEAMDKIADSMLIYRPGEAPWKFNGAAPENNATTPTYENRRIVPEFSIRRLRAEDMRAPRWAHEGYFLVGALNGLVGVGGAGKSTFMGWQLARWTRGDLPGHLEGRPAKVLVVGDEDNALEAWVPRIVASGGDMEHVFALNYDSGVPLDLVRDIGKLEQFVVDKQIDVIFFDQVLDHIGADLSSHIQKDVRTALGPIRNLARRLENTVAFAMHPNKTSGQLALRDRAGGSGQFVDLPRSGLILGYHPDRDGYRALARGKGNVGAVPPALVFTIEPTFTVNPSTGETVDVAVLANLEEEAGLTAEDISSHPPKPREATSKFVCERVVYELGADGAWHTRKEAEKACVDAGVSTDTFRREFPEWGFIERDKRGRETWWRVTDG